MFFNIDVFFQMLFLFCVSMDHSDFAIFQAKWFTILRKELFNIEVEE